MNRGWIKWFVLGAAACMLLCWLLPAGSTGGIMIITLPFTAVARGLRAMSLASGIGNAAALVLYVLVQSLLRLA